MYTKKLYLKLLTTLFFFTFTNMIMGSKIRMGSKISKDKEYEKELIKEFKPTKTNKTITIVNELAEFKFKSEFYEFISLDRQVNDFLSKILNKKTNGKEKIKELNFIINNGDYTNWDYFVSNEKIKNCFETEYGIKNQKTTNPFAIKKNPSKIFNEIYYPKEKIKNAINNKKNNYNKKINKLRNSYLIGAISGAIILTGSILFAPKAKHIVLKAGSAAIIGGTAIQQLTKNKEDKLISALKVPETECFSFASCNEKTKQNKNAIENIKSRYKRHLLKEKSKLQSEVNIMLKNRKKILMAAQNELKKLNNPGI